MKTLYSNFLNLLDVKKEDGNIVTVSYISFILAGLITVGMGLIVPFLRTEFGLTYEETARFLTAHQTGNIISIICAGFLPYIIGKKQTAVILCSTLIIGFLVITFDKNAFVLLLAFALVGIGKGATGNFSNASIAEFARNRALALNLLHATSASGALLGPFLFYFSVKLNTSFRFATLFLTVFSVVIVYLFCVSKLSSKPTEKDNEGSLKFLKSHWFWIDSLTLCFYIAVEVSIISWFVIYFSETGLLSPMMSNFTPILMWSMMVIGRITCANISNKVNPDKLVLCLCISLLICFSLLLFVSSPIMIFIMLGLTGFSMSGIYPTTYSTMRGAENTILTGFALSISSAGGVFMPPIVGTVADVHGIKIGVLTIVGAVIILLCLVITKVILTNREKA